jgi:SAM-dependent methyltransferase
VSRTNDYLGFDVSEELIKLADEHTPGCWFEVADAVDFVYPKNVDVIFAFASLLHLNKQEVALVFSKAHEALNPGGIFYISLKWSPEYTQEVKTDEFGTRLFYYYNSDLIQALAGPQYESVYSEREIHGNTDWFEIALKKTATPDHL